MTPSKCIDIILLSNKRTKNNKFGCKAIILKPLSDKL